MIQIKTPAASLTFQGNGSWYKGEDGKDGYTPVKGVDYWTEADKEEIKNEIEDLEEVHVGVDEPDADSEALIWMIPDGEGELGDLATKEYVDQKVADVEVDLSGYYTKSEVDNAISQVELTPGPAGQDYVLTDADKQEIAGMVPGADLTNYVQKTDIGSNTALGLVKTLANGASYGVNINASGILNIVGANATDISSKTHAYKPLTPNNLDYIMEVGLTTNSRTLSAEKQAAAKAWLGITETGAGGQVDLSSYRTLSNNTFENGIVATDGTSTMNFKPTGIDCGTGAVEIAATGEAHFTDIYSNSKLVATQEYVGTMISEIELTPGPQGETGAAGQDGYSPVKGTDYWTAEDQAAIVTDVLAALPAAEEVSV